MKHAKPGIFDPFRDPTVDAAPGAPASKEQWFVFHGRAFDVKIKMTKAHVQADAQAALFEAAGTRPRAFKDSASAIDFLAPFLILNQKTKHEIVVRRRA